MSKKYKVSDLPLVCFNFVVLVDVDPEEFLPVMDEQKRNALLALTSGMCERITSELYIEDETTEAIRQYEMEHNEHIAPAQETIIIWFRMNGGEDENLFSEIFDYAPVAFQAPWQYSLPHLITYFIGATTQSKEKVRVAVIGATFENGVPQIAAELSKNQRMAVVIVPRYCLSEAGFDNIDEIFIQGGLYYDDDNGIDEGD